MGMFSEYLSGIGKNKQEAYNNAVDEYNYEYGHSHQVRSTISAELVKKIPPEKSVVEKRQGRWSSIEVHKSVPDTEAPPEKWLEQWQFEVWVHM